MIPTLTLVAVLAVLLCSGLWIAWTLGFVAWVGVSFFSATRPEITLVTAYWNTYANLSLASLPMFIWMGEILFRTRLAQQMFAGLAPWLDKLPGRLLHVNILGCGIFGSVSGSSAATTATIAKITLPELQQRGYDRRLALGSLCGAGTLGILIPPSIAMIVYAVAADVSIIRIFLAGVMPGLMLLVMFSGWIVIWALMNPDRMPPETVKMPLRERIRASRELIPVMLLILGVFLSMVLGIATATEASAFGVLGALLIAAGTGSLTRTSFAQSVEGSLRLSGMILFILGASAFLTVAMGFTGIPKALSAWVVSLELSPYTLILLLTLMYLVLGSVLDGVSMIVLTTAVVLPMVQAVGFDPIWFGIYIILMIELAEITPPVGFNLFVLQNMSGEGIMAIARASLPFFVLLLVATAAIVVFQSIATWFPLWVMGK